MALALRRGSATRAGVLLRAWLHTGPSGGPACAAALVVDWQRGLLEVRARAALFNRVGKLGLRGAWLLRSDPGSLVSSAGVKTFARPPLWCQARSCHSSGGHGADRGFRGLGLG